MLRKRTLTGLLLIFFYSSVQAQDDDYYTKMRAITLTDIPTDQLSFVTLGQGFDMTNPWAPVHSAYSPFKPTAPVVATKIANLRKPRTVRFDIHNADITSANNYSYNYNLNVDDDDLAQYYYADISGGGLGWGVSAAVSYVHNHYDAHSAVKITIMDQYTDQVNDINVTPNWTKDPFSNSPELTDEQRWKAFKSLYGSHYVNSLTYGWRIEIIAFANSGDDNTKLSIKSSFDAWAISGDFGANVSTTLHQATTNISAKIYCGSITDATNGSNLPFVLTTLDDIMSFLSKLSKGTINITGGPISMSCVSYAGSVCQSYPTHCKLFDIGSIPLDANVVPRGTIWAWQPAPEYINSDGSIKPPAGGWLVCNATNHAINPSVPDLSSTFLMGANGDSPVGSTGGQNSRQLKQNTSDAIMGQQIAGDNVASFDINGDRRMHNHSVDFGNIDFRPQYYTVVYIIKM